MAIILKQSTASQEILLGPFLDDTDGKTAETGLTIANTDIKIWKAGGTSEASKNSGGATHIAAGRYYAVLDATDTDTLGSLEINVHVAGALPVRRECVVLAANVYDSLIGGTDLLQVDVSQFGNSAGTFSGGRPEVNTTHAAGTALVAGYLDTEIAAIKAKTDNLPASPAATGDIPTAAAIADAVWDEAIAGHAGAGSTGEALAAAGAAGDPWITALPGGYSAGQAGYIVAAIAADAAAADLRGERTVARGTVTTGGSTTSIPTSAFTPAGAAADQFKGRIVIFDIDTATAALRGQATDITASSNSATPTLTVTELTTAPASGDTFTVV